ncbi:thiamine pyrophosphokinase [Fusarium falciforme]|nr:thiamine pyrophosphokinase [Fusarium falciforme]
MAEPTDSTSSHPSTANTPTSSSSSATLTLSPQQFANSTLPNRRLQPSSMTPTKSQPTLARPSTGFEKSIPEESISSLSGGIGGRVDQGLSQLHHLYLFQTDPNYASGRIYLLSGFSLTFLLKPGTHNIQVREDGEEDSFGKHVGIIPLKEPANITTHGLEWDVTDWHTEIGGHLSTSNHILPDVQFVQVTTDRDVLFTVALKQGEGEDHD